MTDVEQGVRFVEFVIGELRHRGQTRAAVVTALELVLVEAMLEREESEQVLERLRSHRRALERCVPDIAALAEAWLAEELRAGD